MSTKSIYVVYGSTGEYVDYREWAVRAFANETNGRNFAEKVKKRYLELVAQYGDDLRNAPEGYNELDPDMEWDGEYTHYGLVEVPFDDDPTCSCAEELASALNSLEQVEAEGDLYLKEEARNKPGYMGNVNGLGADPDVP